MSMKPGATASPAASIVRAAVAPLKIADRSDLTVANAHVRAPAVRARAVIDECH